LFSFLLIQQLCTPSWAYNHKIRDCPLKNLITNGQMRPLYMLPPEVSGDQPHLTTCYHLKAVPKGLFNLRQSFWKVILEDLKLVYF